MAADKAFLAFIFFGNGLILTLWARTYRGPQAHTLKNEKNQILFKFKLQNRLIFIYLSWSYGLSIQNNSINKICSQLGGDIEKVPSTKKEALQFTQGLLIIGNRESSYLIIMFIENKFSGE